jgi:hypothetical protein
MPAPSPVLVTAWVTLVLWCFGECLRARSQDAQGTAPRIAWTLGASALVLHLLAAFAIRHHWSHTAAVMETARQTSEVFGIRWGGGVWINYGLALWWGLDVVAVWCLPTWPHRWVRYERLRLGVFLFLWFNAAVVFAHGPSRLLGIAACTAVAVSWARRHRQQIGSQAGRHGVRE